MARTKGEKTTEKKTTTKKGTAKAAISDSTSESSDEANPFDVFQSVEEATDGGKKRLSIEQIYQKKTQLEHILLRPSTYIGSVDPHVEAHWVFDMETEKMVMKNITYVPGLYKIFDEIVVNAADNKQRDPTMSAIKINIDAEKNEISVWNNGRGIPVVEHRTEKMYVPEMIFGTLLTSSNYDDSENRLTGGLNGFGAKLCNIFSTKFTVETSSVQYKKSFKQTWRDNMNNTDKATIGNSKESDFTCVTFSPDLAKFGMAKLDADIVALMSRRAYDLAGSTKGVVVFLNGKKLPVKGFKQYVEQYTKGRLDDNEEPLKVVFHEPDKRWEIALTLSETGTFQQISFVNSIATMKGGRHVDYVCEQIVEKLVEQVKKQIKKIGMNIRPSQVKNHMWLFVNCLIVNPTFDSQTKDCMTLPAKSFGSKFEVAEKFIQQASKCGVVESVLDWLKGKAQTQLDKQCHATKHSKLKGLPKLDDANDAGTKNSHLCTIILTEGDSAKTLAVAGLGVVGRDRFGAFPLRGKVLNVREATHKQIMENAEINALIKIVGLQYKKKYDSLDDIKTLRYGKIMIMTDQDQDGSHIKGLLINFIYHNWPALLRHNFLEEFITPIVKATRGKDEISFYSMPEYEEWKSQTPDWNKWQIKYYKGLGTSTAKEAKEYFANMQRHQIRFDYGGDGDERALDLAFSKKMADNRKDWLTGWMEERKTRRRENLPDVYLYERHTKAVTFEDFVKKELVLFSNMDNERSIPSLVDGLKPGQRKVLFTCFKRNDKREVKVAQLAGSVAEMSAYHHGEQSLMSTIVNLAQNFVGSNNINLLLPIGQFGTRLQGGKDSASPRYIFTMLNPVTRAMFPVADDPCLDYTWDDNKKTEPEYYCPILPTVLVNGAEGIGTGWATKVPLYNPREIVDNIKRLIEGEALTPMMPWYKNYRGTIAVLGPQRYIDSGEISILDDGSIEITELPHDTATQAYKENVLDPMLNGTEKQQPSITDYREYHTDLTVRFVVKMEAAKLAKFRQDGLHKMFKLQSNINLSSMVLFDADGCLRKFDNVEDIMREFYTVRLKLYEKRHAYLDGLLQAEANRLSNQARFILEKIDGKIIMEKKKKRDIVEQLVKRNYDPDPVQKWKDEEKKKEKNNDDQQQEEELSADETDEADAKMSVFDYLVKMQLIKLSEEEVAKLLRQRDEKMTELNTLRSKTPKDLWREDLDTFAAALDKQEAKEKEEEEIGIPGQDGGAGGKKGGKKGEKTAAGDKSKKGGAVKKEDTLPSKNGSRVEPVVDSATKEKFEKIDKVKIDKAAGVVKVKRVVKEKGAVKEKVVRKAKKDTDDLENSALPKPKRAKKRLSNEMKPVPDGEGTSSTRKRSRSRISSKKELVLFSNMDNERSIPSLVDGLTPGQRKVLFTCFKRNDKREVKVAQLAGSVAEMSAYHHEHQKLLTTIVNLAQNFVGSNNINLLLPIGQFGTRLEGGKDSASPRYIFTMLNPVTRAMFPLADDPCLDYTWDDNKKTEPEYYCPILPTVLVNGAEGIGTGWATKVPLYNPREIVDNIKRLIEGEAPLPMVPWYKNYRGTIAVLGPQRYIDSGEISILDDESIEITELPHDTATQAYKENVLEPMLNGTEKQQPSITDYDEYYTDLTVRFVVKMEAAKLAKFRQDGLHKMFKLQSNINLSSMVLFDADGCLRKFENVEDIMREFYAVRLKLYEKRHAYLDGLLQAEASRLSNQARFILEKNDGKIIMEKKKKRDIVEQLIKRNYDPDPVQKWKDEEKKKEKNKDDQQQEEELSADETDEADAKMSVFDYLVKMQVFEDEVAKLLRQRDEKMTELNTLRSKTPKDLWREDLDTFAAALDKQEAKEKEEEEIGIPGQDGAGGASKKGDTLPSKNGRRVEPVVDSATKEKFEKIDKVKIDKAAGVVKEKGAVKEKVLKKEENSGEDEPWVIEDDSDESFAAPSSSRVVDRPALASKQVVYNIDDDEDESDDD